MISPTACPISSSRDGRHRNERKGRLDAREGNGGGASKDFSKNEKIKKRTLEKSFADVDHPSLSSCPFIFLVDERDGDERN